MLEAVDPDGDGLWPQTHDWERNIWTEWVAPNRRDGTYNYSTARNYILVLEESCKFLKSRQMAEKLDSYANGRVADLNRASTEMEEDDKQMRYGRS